MAVPEYFEFEVSLADVGPRIWRRFLLCADSATFHDLHEAIQKACGWQNAHLFQFLQLGGGPRKLPIAGIPSAEDLGLYGRKTPDARKVQLHSFFGQEKSIQCLYLYDFGDSWLHELKLVAESPLPEVFRRRLTGGGRSFPPEDSGGITGYRRFLQVVEDGKDPQNEDLGDLFAWIGKWDPERFSLEEVGKKFDR